MIGTMIGSLRMAEELGDGGAGAVYRAVDLASGDQVAIRIFASEVTREPALVERLRAMVPALRRLHHPGVAAVYDLIEAAGHLGFRLEYVAGLTLEQTRGAMGRLDTCVAVSCTAQVLRGLEHAHRGGVYHHALRPTNVMVTPHGGVKVMDFGIGHALGANRKTREDRLATVLAYLAPEQAQNQPGDARSDIYAAGVVLYELLTGRRPFAHRTEFAVRQALLHESAASPRTLVADIPDWVEQAVMRALSKNPAQRYQNATEMCAVLEAGLRLSAAGTALLERGRSAADAPTVVLHPRSTQAAAAPTAGEPSDATVIVAPPPSAVPSVQPLAEPSDATVAIVPSPGADPSARPLAEPSIATVDVARLPRPVPPAATPIEESTAAVRRAEPFGTVPVVPIPDSPSTAAVTGAQSAVATSPVPLPADSAPPALGADGAAQTATERAVDRGAGPAPPGPAPSLPQAAAVSEVSPQPASARAAGGRTAPAATGARSDAGGSPAARKTSVQPAARGAWRRPALLALAALLAVALGVAGALYWTTYHVPAPAAEPASIEAPGPPALEPADAGTVPTAQAAAVPIAAEPPAAPVTTIVPESPAASSPVAAPPAGSPAPHAAVQPAAPRRAAKPKPGPDPSAGRSGPAPVIAPPPPLVAEPLPVVPAEPSPLVTAAERQPEVRLPDVTFLKVKLLLGQGEKTREVDVSLVFLEDRVGVSPERGGTAIRSVRYQDVTRATYEREQRRRLFGTSARHLLTIETSGEPLFLRLDNSNVDAVIRAFEERSQKIVER